ncbi:23S rRNA (pseudouridine(1915)-N(3))-methyltransferase RlmH [Prochlorococcus marinus]|uniref:Ribosomal RNA large subunit methyltransferase H n=1 Tax=Prochlorococcus marinus (strain MIT 9211) TaxID=93059 RepID=RLMH_PROM4|nr:23S rRNA (pseudouridine(1915)-N(3))-methyltransferase RlmH [Prochlorococcus marinus]A9B9X8.1 RecName: Full=Ribosomal RNA large subunit methyltransferase H; AltName: Full=23S rRNA (pseudouridine1915-N3)-methyltransferase; AltName: Full=23S rRNA m3Psi1915 methyltransferase; AltName: Full=rRNA (pseudouridine-N3-)-methyltransferase RlmH [Prochlorococcus marinus str. MIT 9211]ABX08640.1 Conserved hypothetical protein [Prochlorococcus marinus str. MIT 9211]
MLNPSRYRILAIGKTRKAWIQNGLNLYIKRLPGLTITELKDSDLKKEAQSIRSSIKTNELLIILTEEGESLTSLGFANRLKSLGSSRLLFVIGSANGLDSEIKAMANWSISLSPLTFPHEIARLLLIEQLYRAKNICEGGSYHRN